MINNYLLAALLAALIPFSESKAQGNNEAQVQTQAQTTSVTVFTPEIGGIKQFVEVKTDDPSKPVLLFLSGGPGSSMVNGAPAFTGLLKSRFTIVQWDQRDAGRTLKLNPSPVQPSLALMEKDTLEVIQFLRKELKQDKIYLLGSSFGNALGFYIVKNHPQLLHAYFASNPVVSQLASEKELLAILKNHFKDDAVASQELASVNLPLKVDEDMFYLRKWLFFKEGNKQATSDGFKAGFMQWSKTWSPVWRDVTAIDLPKTLKKVDCPVYFFVGNNDIQTSTQITKDYFEALQAPRKDLFVFENSGHQVHQAEAEKFQQVILSLVPAAQAAK